MGTLTNSEYPDEMQHYAAFHRGLHCLLRLKQPLGTEILNKFKNYICEPFKIHNGLSHVYCVKFVFANSSAYKGKRTCDKYHCIMTLPSFIDLCCSLISTRSVKDGAYN